ncbi:MAG: hypothetical protein A3G32_08120 [Deltaproteobacteria bacterium RIFCSPLOWO2_12_FULL_40_28]|nr:MAG: hypothetical protein A3C45_00820 [Deltaproteobacteria bacterium RIFCSPHIGHO2_02_FULL_40_28]OGQ20875.1 MAG: hypothetical protein A3E27_03485 [Deltaproteobacteria bacterium RIFCSPHIGHO2_12_FULL_40_32]OGQ39276.1 MAG: hypothetical protein A3I69_04845 [Deltaproteobacteria bacterium RIFCSPLOWO2_02_FULL_40_36]OGQ54557.1 MAG: hypothetical protein A3G32_08120 [Deltaproteobacteria bacterium RIFCSPLOWO2_12_FULL_40_28]
MPSLNFVKPNNHLPFKIIYQDHDYLFIDKPHGFHSIALNEKDETTVVNWLHAKIPQNLSWASPLEMGLLNRLDFETSGLLLCALSPQAYQLARDLFKKRLVQKEYLCLTEKSPPLDLHRAYAVGRYRGSKKVSFFSKEKRNTKEVLTEIIDFQKTQEGFLVAIRLITGFRHQIRAHLSFLGCPIKGDGLYGGAPYKRLMLQSQKLAFQLPSSRLYSHESGLIFP